MESCYKQETGCGFNCLESTEVEEIENNKNIKYSNYCSICNDNAGKFESIIAKYGCGTYSDMFIGTICE